MGVRHSWWQGPGDPISLLHEVQPLSRPLLSSWAVSKPTLTRRLSAGEGGPEGVALCVEHQRPGGGQSGNGTFGLITLSLAGLRDEPQPDLHPGEELRDEAGDGD